MQTQQSRRNIGIIMIVFGLIIIALIVFFIIREPNEVEENPIINNPIEGEQPIEQEGTTTPSDMPRNYQEYDISKEKDHEFNAFDLGKMSDSFAERFGSFTNQSQYENFTDLKMFMTDSFANWVDGYVEDLIEQSPKNQYFYGISTTALSHKIEKFNEEAGEATVIINTQRKETTIEGDNESFLQKLELNFEKVNDEWLVDSAYWEK